MKLVYYQYEISEQRKGEIFRLVSKIQENFFLNPLRVFSLIKMNKH